MSIEDFKKLTGLVTSLNGKTLEEKDYSYYSDRLFQKGLDFVSTLLLKIKENCGKFYHEAKVYNPLISRGLYGEYGKWS